MSMTSDVHSADRAFLREVCYKTTLCHYYCGKGFCGRGERCPYAHGESELRQHPQFKTKMCTKVGCRMVGCTFAHDLEELLPEKCGNLGGGASSISASMRSERNSHAGGRGLTKSKTKLCRFWMSETCAKGERCNFAHGELELRQGAEKRERSPSAATLSTAASPYTTAAASPYTTAAASPYSTEGGHEDLEEVQDDLRVAEFLPGPAMGPLPALQGAKQAVQSPEVLDDLTVAEVAVGEVLLAPGLPSESLPLFNWKVTQEQEGVCKVERDGFELFENNTFLDVRKVTQEQEGVCKEERDGFELFVNNTFLDVRKVSATGLVQRSHSAPPVGSPCPA